MTERDLRISIFITSSYLTFSGEVGSVLTVSGGIAKGRYKLAHMETVASLTEEIR